MKICQQNPTKIKWFRLIIKKWHRLTRIGENDIIYMKIYAKIIPMFEEYYADSYSLQKCGGHI